MHWLNPTNAANVGITYSLIKPSTPDPRPFIAPPQPQYQAPSPAESPAEQQARQLVLAYNAYWSQGGANVDGLAAYYADSVSFYGTMVSRDKLMDVKRKFSIRWPIRQYTVDLSSLSVQCDGATCTATGVVAWDCTSRERGAHSVGAAKFAYRIVNGLIVSESGSVLARQADTADSQQASQTTSYAQGRQARLEYEQWYSSLPDGGYKDGATFWATHRSVKPSPPNCMGSPEQVAGCVAARIRLTPSDIRRNSDRNFWLGWNSL
jgi:hypothetical protein